MYRNIQEVCTCTLPTATIQNLPKTNILVMNDNFHFFHGSWTLAPCISGRFLKKLTNQTDPPDAACQIFHKIEVGRFQLGTIRARILTSL